jgi:hypothetical protein
MGAQSALAAWAGQLVVQTEELRAKILGVNPVKV